MLYQNLWNLSNYWSVKKSWGLFLFKRNDMKNRKGTLTPKMPFAVRFFAARRNRAFQLLSLQVDAGTVEPPFAVTTTQLKRLGNSRFITSNVVSSVWRGSSQITSVLKLTIAYSCDQITNHNHNSFFSISLQKRNSYPFSRMRHITCSTTTADVINRIWNA